MRASQHEQRIAAIAREARHAHATRWPEGDSWIQGYAEDVSYLLRYVHELEETWDDRPTIAEVRERMAE